ncbi:MAG: hypothetical protein KBS89_07555 [Bacteroidales bacterium]|nr:hypothetical protein [Candidatus Egerieousia equi]
MAKGSGGTRYQGPVAGIDSAPSLSGDTTGVLSSVMTRYNSYGEGWEKTYLSESGGFVVTAIQRKEKGNQNKQEALKFEKEQRMCKKYASFGFQIEHLSEVTGISSSDTRIVRHPQGVIRINGALADLKSTGSANNIVSYATKATTKQGAKYVLFEFTKHDPKIPSEIKKLIKKGIQGYYYFSDENTYYSF